MLSYKKLDVYRCSIEFLALASGLRPALPKGHGGLGDQLYRASLSIPLNIAEGTGKARGADKARFYAIARGSAMECGAILDACVAMRLVPGESAHRGEALIVRIVEMLTRLGRLA